MRKDLVSEGGPPRLPGLAERALAGQPWAGCIFIGGSSAKFWAVRTAGSYLQLWWGRLGTTGQTRVKEYAARWAAERSAELLMFEKLARGYVRRSGHGLFEPWSYSKPIVPDPELGHKILSARARAARSQKKDRTIIKKQPAARKPPPPLAPFSKARFQTLHHGDEDEEGET